MLTAAVNDALHLQISIRADARKHNINYALLIRYFKKARENLTPGTIIPLKQRFPNFFCLRRPSKTYQYSRRLNEAKICKF